MTLTADSLLTNLNDAYGGVRVIPLDQQRAFAVMIPTGQMSHDWTNLAVEHLGDDLWIISDAGQARQWLGQEFEEVAAELSAVGAPFTAELGQLVARCSGGAVSDTLISFAYHVGAIPAVWRIRQATRADSRHGPRTSGSRYLASITRDLIVSSLARPADGAYVRLYAPIHGAIDHVKAPLSVQVPTGRHRPELVCSFIDMTGTSSQIRNAKQYTSYLFDAIGSQPTARFIAMRGSAAEIARAQALYDHENISVLDIEEPDDLLAETSRAIGVLAA